MSSWILAAVRLMAICLYTMAALPLFYIGYALRLPYYRAMPQRWHRIVSKLAGLRIQVDGSVSDRHPTLFIANHSSYLDILVLGGLLGAAFIAKKEIENWPVMGRLARAQNTVFVERKPRLAKEQQNQIVQLLDEKNNLVLFPEGTCNNGNHLMPFKSTLFSVTTAMSEKELYVQPITVAYTKINGIPAGRIYRPYLAWYGDMDLMPHLWTLLGLGFVSVRVILHPPVPAARFSTRKELSANCEQQIRDGLRTALERQFPW